jgi:hypothetical protein
MEYVIQPKLPYTQIPSMVKVRDCPFSPHQCALSAHVTARPLAVTGRRARYCAGRLPHTQRIMPALIAALLRLECGSSPSLVGLLLSFCNRLPLQAQKEAVDSKLRGLSNCHVVHPGLQHFVKQVRPGWLLSAPCWPGSSPVLPWEALLLVLGAWLPRRLPHAPPGAAAAGCSQVPVPSEQPRSASWQVGRPIPAPARVQDIPGVKEAGWTADQAEQPK